MLLAAVTFLVALAPSSAGADEAAAHEREYLIKAAFLYNLARFTQWPASAFDPGDTALRMCVLGEDPVGPVLHGIAGKTIRGRAVVVERAGGHEARLRAHGEGQGGGGLKLNMPVLAKFGGRFWILRAA